MGAVQVVRSGSGVLRNAFRAAVKDMSRAAHSSSAHRSRLLYFPLAQISRMRWCFSRLPPGWLCLASMAFLPLALRQFGELTPEVGVALSALAACPSPECAAAESFTLLSPAEVRWAFFDRLAELEQPLSSADCPLISS